MYVTGQGTDGYGTILPAIIEHSYNNSNINEIHIVGTNKRSSLGAEKRYKLLKKKTSISLNLKFYPQNGSDNKAYQNVISNLKGPACAIIAVPDHLHYNIIKYCLKAGLHTLVVKPFTTKLNEAKDLIALTRKNNLYGAVEFHKRWDNQNLFAKNSLDNDSIGKLLYTIVEYSQKKSIPQKHFKSWAEKTNIFQYLGVHYVDLIHFITSAKPVRVMAVGQKNWLKKQSIDTFDSMQSFIEWEQEDGNKFIQSIHVNWIDSNNSTATSDQKLKFIGTKGRIEFDQKDRGISIISDHKNLEHINLDFSRSYIDSNEKLFFKGYGIDSIKTFLSDVVDIFAKKKTPIEFEGIRPTFISSQISVAVTEQINNSINDNSNWKYITF